MPERVRTHHALVLVVLVLLGGCLSGGRTPTESVSSGPQPSPSWPSPSWPSPADSGPAPQNVDQLGIIGDSLTAEMIDYGQLEPALVSAGWSSSSIRMDGEWGRPIDGPGASSTSEVIRSWREDGFDPRVWLVALGTNNASDPVPEWHKDIRGVLNEINSGPAGNYIIYWVGTGYPQQDANNSTLFLQTLHEIAGDYPNVIVADYDAYLDGYRSDPDWADMWADPVHHSQSGYEQVRTPFYLSVLAPEAPG